MAEFWGAIEAGGTKFNLAIGKGPDELIAERRVPTTSPEETLAEVISFFKDHDPVSAIGLGCFGPVDLAGGCITNTPKPGWQDFPIVPTLENALQTPVVFDTDVNAAALAEGRWGAAKGLQNHVYITIGTGVGGGVVVNGQAVHGLIHPEVGHMRVKRHEDDLDFEGICPFHKDCLEGLASGPAMKQRTGVAAEHLDIEDIAWDIEAEYLAQMCHNLCLVLSPEKIVLGGGVMAKPGLLAKVQKAFVATLNGYMNVPDDGNYIQATALGGIAGLYGAFALAMDGKQAG